MTLLSFFCVCSCKNLDIEIHIFSNIEECINIENNNKADAIIEKYDSLENDTVKAYLKNETGITTENDIHFLDSTGMSKSKRMVISDNKAYCVYTKKKDFEKVKEFINNCFSEKISVNTTDNKE